MVFHICYIFDIMVVCLRYMGCIWLLILGCICLRYVVVNIGLYVVVDIGLYMFEIFCICFLIYGC
jgi:hypothetical protein